MQRVGNSYFEFLYVFVKGEKTTRVSNSTTLTICENMMPGLHLWVSGQIVGSLFLLNRKTGYLLDIACTSAQR